MITVSEYKDYQSHKESYHDPADSLILSLQYMICLRSSVVMFRSYSVEIVGTPL